MAQTSNSLKWTLGKRKRQGKSDSIVCFQNVVAAAAAAAAGFWQKTKAKTKSTQS